MKVLVIGSGGREHALVWKLKQSRKIEKIFCAPGNGGISRLAKCVNIKADNVAAQVDFAARNKINLTVVGPENALAAGIVDAFQKKKLKIFGPARDAARLETSKVFAKEFMRKYHVPTAPFKVFKSAAEAIGFCKSVEFPVVVKADGLAAGKGVIVCRTMAEAEAAIDTIITQKAFGKAGETILIESFLRGQELSILALTDGKVIVPLLSAQDHKQAFDGDTGPNTGGMGAYAPTPLVDEPTLELIREQVFAPVINGFNQEGIDYRGVLYAGLMMTEAGPKVLEFNCRFGDPETQVILPLMKSDLVEIMTAVASRKLANMRKIEWRNESAACVVMASRGYPGEYAVGQPINGLREISDKQVIVFHAGTERTQGDRFRTAGGRVLNVVGIDRDLESAIKRAYGGVRRIRFDGATFRTDIGFRVLTAKQPSNS